MRNPAISQVDRLSALLDRFRVRATLFHTGALCGAQTFEAVPGRGFLHVLRRGEMELRHRPGGGLAPRLRLDEPTLLFYPRALRHEFVNPPVDGSDFTCAALDFDGGERHPLVQSLPPLIRVPLDEVEGLRPALDLLFAEADHVRCGSRLLADRLFEVVLIQLLRWILDHPARAGVNSGLMMGLADPRLARALVAVHRSPCDEWPLAKMAEIAGMSRSAFAAAFKAATGATPAAYLADWRLSLAASMMRGGRPVKQVAAELGYASASSLSKAFRQRMGASPREWLAAPARGVRRSS
ncbi:AraC family transcriptional regulator [Achromobacter sp. HZ01]|jgi:AraC-like DNA-binding protein|uniref:AraC family transcriptional regulator n=1 Tax=Achromobacter sp. HZ01 TaxID=1416886 RepID=UPI000DC4FB3A|nr:AraC family transcriptional regulator [Achromobacter sp. HZ01]RAP63232.1 AraC family transcriptional regulator [Achromobacter sp. HZ01]